MCVPVQKMLGGMWNRTHLGYKEFNIPLTEERPEVGASNLAWFDLIAMQVVVILLRVQGRDMAK